MMKIGKKMKIGSILLGALGFVLVSNQGVWANVKVGYYVSSPSHQSYKHSYGHKKSRHHKYKKRKNSNWGHGYVGPYEHSHEYEFHGFTYSLPFGSKKVKAHHNSYYYYYDGTFYKKCNHSGYDIVKAPYGIEIRHLPVGYKTKFKYGKKYYYHNNTYYQKSPRKGYVVVKGPKHDHYHEEHDYWGHDYKGHNYGGHGHNSRYCSTKY